MSIESPQQPTPLHHWLHTSIKKNSEIICWLFFFGLFAINSAYWIIKPLDHDVAWILYSASRMLKGATLYVDIIDPNPPLIFYISTLPTLIANLLGWSQVITFKLCFVSIALLSLVLSGQLTREGVFLIPDLIRNIFLFTLAFVFFIYIERNFGQREHLMFMLVMPYILASIGCAEGRPTRGTFAVLLGTLAGLGMAIKPHFLLLWIGMEVYLKLAYPNKPNWRRLENIAIAMVMMTYGILVLLFSREYFEIAAMAARVYGARNLRFIDLLNNPAIGLWIIGLATFVAARFNSQNKVAKEVLLILSTAFLLIAIIQQKGWSYHFYPVRAAVILLLTITVPQLLGALYRFTGENLRVPRILRAAATSVVLILMAVGLYKTILTPTYRIAYWSLEAAYNVAKGTTLFHEAASTLLRNSFEDGLRPPLKELISVVEEHAHRKPILVLSITIFPSFPLINYSNTSWSSRFPCLWLLPGSYQNSSLSQAGSLYHSYNQMDDVERFLFQGVISDMANKPPALLIIDSSPYKPGFGQTKFDFIDYFSQDARFTSMLSEYDLLTKVSSYVIYKRRGS